MVRPLVRFVRTVENLGTGTSGNRRHTIGRRVNLLHVSAGAGGTAAPTEQPPVRVALLIGDFPTKLAKLADGWVRAPPAPGSSMMLSWDGRIPTSANDDWVVVLLWRNDTGVTDLPILFLHLEEDIL